MCELVWYNGCDVQFPSCCRRLFVNAQVIFAVRYKTPVLHCSALRRQCHVIWRAKECHCPNTVTCISHIDLWPATYIKHSILVECFFQSTTSQKLLAVYMTTCGTYFSAVFLFAVLTFCFHTRNKIILSNDLFTTILANMISTCWWLLNILKLNSKFISTPISKLGWYETGKGTCSRAHASLPLVWRSLGVESHDNVILQCTRYLSMTLWAFRMESWQHVYAKLAMFTRCLLTAYNGMNEP